MKNPHINMDLIKRKPVISISDQVIPKLACSAIEALGRKLNILLVASLDMILSMVNNKGADQNAQMRRLICSFVVRKP